MHTAAEQGSEGGMLMRLVKGKDRNDGWEFQSRTLQKNRAAEMEMKPLIHILERQKSESGTLFFFPA